MAHLICLGADSVKRVNDCLSSRFITVSRSHLRYWSAIWAQTLSARLWIRSLRCPPGDVNKMATWMHKVGQVNLRKSVDRFTEMNYSNSTPECKIRLHPSVYRHVSLRPWQIDPSRNPPPQRLSCWTWKSFHRIRLVGRRLTFLHA